MAETSTIEWTDATWNPIVGCSIVSPGCTNCYAMSDAWRKNFNPKTPQYHGLTTRGPNGDKPPVWTGKVALAETALLAPLRRKEPTTWFVNSMGDLFHEAVPVEWIDRVFAVMALCPQHTFQVLTKRSARMRGYLTDVKTPARIASDGLHEATIGFPARHALVFNATWPLPNVWLGVSAERQQEADERVPELLATPAAIRFVSAEPLLGPVDFENFCDGMKFIDALRGHWMHDCEGPYIERGKPKLDWIIVGGESGKGARPMHPDWARSIRDQCAEAGVPFFFKQWGEWTDDRGPQDYGDPIMDGRARCAVWDGASWTYHANGYEPDLHAGAGEWVYRIGKRRAGRLLDGVEHNGMPGR